MAILKQSDRIRSIVIDKYVEPARLSGQTHISIHARDVLKDAEATQNFPRGRTPTICQVLQSNKLLAEAGLKLEGIEGPPSLQSRTVVAHYRLVGARHSKSVATLSGRDMERDVAEGPEERANRLTAKLFGLLKDEYAEYGGGEKFLEWMRSEDSGEKVA